MSKLYRLLAALLIAPLLLAGCASKPASLLDVTPASDPRNDDGRAIVIMAILQENPRGLFSGERPVRYLVAMERPIRVMEGGESVVKSAFLSYGASVVSIPSGRYYLRSFRVGQVSRRAGWDPNKNEPRVLEFGVEEQDVVYLGHVIVTPAGDGRGDYILFRVENRKADAEEMLRDTFGDRANELIGRMETRLVTVPKAVW